MNLPPRRARPPRAGVSMLELLIAVTIVALLLSLLLPAVQHARESARRLTCANNMKQLGVSLAIGGNMLANLEQQYATPDLVIPTFLCPTDGGSPLVQSATKGRSNYAIVTGDGTEQNEGNDDGLSTTFATGEQNSDDVDPDQGWHDRPKADCEKPLNYRDADGKTDPNSFGSKHPAGANFLMLDGAVRFINDTIDLETYHALSTPSAGDVVGSF